MKPTEYQYGGADYLETDMAQKRPRDQQAGDRGQYQEAGADSVGEMTERAIKPPFSNPGDKNEFQMDGADHVELGRSQSWPWEKHLPGATKPTT